jgi:hypothetical protein
MYGMYGIYVTHFMNGVNYTIGILVWFSRPKSSTYHHRRIISINQESSFLARPATTNADIISIARAAGWSIRMHGTHCTAKLADTYVVLVFGQGTGRLAVQSILDVAAGSAIFRTLYQWSKIDD